MGPHLSIYVSDSVYTSGETVGSVMKLKEILVKNLNENSFFYVNSGLFQGELANSMCDNWKNAPSGRIIFITNDLGLVLFCSRSLE